MNVEVNLPVAEHAEPVCVETYRTEVLFEGTLDDCRRRIDELVDWERLREKAGVGRSSLWERWAAEHHRAREADKEHS